MTSLPMAVCTSLVLYFFFPLPALNHCSRWHALACVLPSHSLFYLTESLYMTLFLQFLSTVSPCLQSVSPPRDYLSCNLWNHISPNSQSLPTPAWPLWFAWVHWPLLLFDYVICASFEPQVSALYPHIPSLRISTPSLPALSVLSLTDIKSLERNLSSSKNTPKHTSSEKLHYFLEVIQNL